METLGDRIKKIRGPLSQADFANMVFVSQRSIGHYEKNERQPDAETIKTICACFDISADWLLFGEGKPFKDGDENINSEDEIRQNSFKDNGSDSIELNKVVIGERIKSLRGEESRSSFADTLMVPASSLARWEAGESFPDISFIVRLSATFNITIEWLLTGKEASASTSAVDQLEFLNSFELTPKISDVGEKTNHQKSQHIYFIEPDKNEESKTSNVSEISAGKMMELYDRLVALQAENADLRVERERMLGQMAALEKEIARLKEVSPRPFTTAATAVVGASAPGPVSEADMSNTAKTTPAPMPDEQPRSR